MFGSAHSSHNESNEFQKARNAYLNIEEEFQFFEQEYAEKNSSNKDLKTFKSHLQMTVRAEYGTIEKIAGRVVNEKRRSGQRLLLKEAEAINKLCRTFLKNMEQWQEQLKEWRNRLLEETNSLQAVASITNASHTHLQTGVSPRAEVKSGDSHANNGVASGGAAVSLSSTEISCTVASDSRELSSPRRQSLSIALSSEVTGTVEAERSADSLETTFPGGASNQPLGSSPFGESKAELLADLLPLPPSSSQQSNIDAQLRLLKNFIETNRFELGGRRFDGNLIISKEGLKNRVPRGMQKIYDRIVKHLDLVQQAGNVRTKNVEQSEADLVGYIQTEAGARTQSPAWYQFFNRRSASTMLHYQELVKFGTPSFKQLVSAKVPPAASSAPSSPIR